MKHVGNGVLLFPIVDPWQILKVGLDTFEVGFQLRREQPADQRREAIQL